MELQCGITTTGQVSSQLSETYRHLASVPKKINHTGIRVYTHDIGLQSSKDWSTI
jgi:hypothetical protein